MNFARVSLLAAAMAGSALLSADETDRVRFAVPERIRAGNAYLGEGRYFPSPVLYDLDGDKRPEILVGDLMGKVTVAKRRDAKVDAEQPLLKRDGKPLKFYNW